MYRYRLSLSQRLRPTKKYRPVSGNKRPLNRLDWEHIEGGVGVIKGISKRVIVVSSPDPKIFEQAIFIIREDYAGQAGVSESDVMRQAQEIADHYVKSGGFRPGRLIFRLSAPLYAAVGAIATGLAWLLIQLVH
jgi:hypothetical protein